jgi:hypothetical protein
VEAFDLEDTVNYIRAQTGPLAGATVTDLVTGALSCVACLGLVRIIFQEAASLRQVEPAPFDRAKVVELLKHDKRVA